jgi:hypothetical protein
MGTTTKIGPTVLTPEAIEHLPLELLGHVQGVTHRVLWRSNRSVAGLLTCRPRAGWARIPTGSTTTTSGSLTVCHRARQLLGPGSYGHVPAGAAHDIDTADTDGCTVFYLYAPW